MSDKPKLMILKCPILDRIVSSSIISWATHKFQHTNVNKRLESKIDVTFITESTETHGNL